MRFLVGVADDPRFEDVLGCLRWCVRLGPADQVVVLHATPIAPWALHATDSHAECSAVPWSGVGDEDEKADHVLSEAARLLAQWNIAAETLRVRGNAATEILRVAAERNADIIVVGALGRDRHGFLVGSISQKVKALAHTDVLVVRPGAPVDPSRFRALLAVDGSPESSAAVRTFVTKLHAARAEVLLLHALDFPLVSAWEMLEDETLDIGSLTPALREQADRALSDARANRFKNILLVFGDEIVTTVAFERATALAERHRARLTLASVIETASRDVQLLSAALQPSDVYELLIDERRQQLDRLIGPARQSGARVTGRVLCGTPFLEIIREVLRGEHDLVMITAEAKSPLDETLCCSTSMHLMRKCPCPVWVMKPTTRRRYSHVLAAVDPVPSDERHESLDTKIMELATSPARIEQCHPHIVHAWSPISESTLRYTLRTPPGRVHTIIHESEDIERKRFGELLQKFSLEDVKAQTHLLEGSAGEVIPELARRQRIDVIVMGTVCRTGIAGLLIGNTAETILRRVKCWVLTVKPDGFVTPVTLDG